MASFEITEEEGQYAAKWNILFDRAQTHWMIVEAEEGVHVYSCYACRDLFSSKMSFLDHINRISIGLKYYCPECSSTYNFYNPCTLLFHARKHFHSGGGIINLDNVLVFRLPLGLIGFPPHPDIPLMFDVKEEEITHSYVNSSFYNPMTQQRGSKYVKLVATYLLFLSKKPSGNKTTMVLKQVCSNIPKCVFVATKYAEKCNKSSAVESLNTSGSTINGISNETIIVANTDGINPNTQEESNSVIRKTVNVKVSDVSDIEENLQATFKCPECHVLLGKSGIAHFQQENVPMSSDLQCEICNFISPGLCSFKAHNRLHSATPPFVCPECGITFKKFIELLDHENKACYHFSKQVRLKCNKKHCSKIFAYHINYKQHFATHIQTIVKCIKCEVYYLSQGEFNSHVSLEHQQDVEVPDITYQCQVCEDLTFTEESYKNHIEWHCEPNKMYNQVYVYVCRHCKNYFRTALTYSTHMARCSKKNVMLAELVSMKFGPTMTYCTNCGFMVFFKVSLTSCPKCDMTENLFHHKPESTSSKKLKCTLCSHLVELKDEHKCKFEKPVVVLNKLGNISNTVIIPDHTYGINAHEKFGPKTDKTLEKRKRKSTSPTHQNIKKKTARTSSENSEIALDTPKPFDGTYSCKLCDFNTSERTNFHNHLFEHRDGSVYQCMECGESFVVKPSFEKHLIYFHQITDVDKYIAENECCDKDLENQQENNQENSLDNEPLEENQCRVCRQKFNDELDLKKHFRVHGMAFILNKTKVNN